MLLDYCLFLVKICFVFNENSSPMAYKAYFTSNSDRSFSITPEQGELLPASSNGTLLKLSFCPTVYGRTFNGMLIIDVCRKESLNYL
jgi:hypothetical protein